MTPPSLREDIAQHVHNALPRIYWTECHYHGIAPVDREILESEGEALKGWAHTRGMLQEGQGRTLSQIEMATALDYAAFTLHFCIANDNSVMRPLRFDDVWHMELTGRSEDSASKIPAEDVTRMAASEHTLDTTTPLATGRIGRMDPEPGVVLTRQRTGALVRVDMTGLDDSRHISEALFLIESQHKARHDLYVSQGTFLIGMHDGAEATQQAWQRWIPNASFFYQSVIIVCGRQPVVVTAHRTDPTQRASAKRQPPQYIETPHTLGPVAI